MQPSSNPTIDSQIRDLQQEMFELKQGTTDSKLRIQRIQQHIDELLNQHKDANRAQGPGR